jgi:hypothetical protein
MNKEQIFSIWAPEDSPWSRWAKPVLFAYLDSPLSHAASRGTPRDVSWCPSPADNVALVLDLPGEEGVLMGVALATQGYRPVPLYNAVPLPFDEAPIDVSTGRSVAAVDVLPIMSALRNGAEELARLNLPTDAPPAFLLDANRRGDGRKMQSEEFDNRSISFTTDFPSANYFIAHGIQHIMLLQEKTDEPQSDIAHSLRRWQDAGFILERKRIDSPKAAERFEVARPSWYGTMFQRVLSSIGLRRSSTGGFGDWVPPSSSGG